MILWRFFTAFLFKGGAAFSPAPSAGTDVYKRPGGVDNYKRPGGVDTYKRP